ncbi:hypothetical protein [Demequina sp. NBRC 110055]|uniref:hypothetical protein n=1 Tax=Demequina sp. NBRC 110055 TaxID=1570344 RepID=UPI001185FD4E|nr:hypothetical protein [Demequina sp. NBRC 110055]
MEWGSVGEWVGGVGSALAAGSAVWLAATRSSRDQRDQAMRVIVVVRRERKPQLLERDLEDWQRDFIRATKESYPAYVANVTNGSDASLTDVELPAAPGWIDTVTPEDEVVMYRPTSHRWDSIGPNTQKSEVILDYPLDYVEFSDRHGTRWRRGKGDLLLKVTSRRELFEQGAMPKSTAWLYRSWLKLRGQPLD